MTYVVINVSLGVYMVLLIFLNCNEACGWCGDVIKIVNEVAASGEAHAKEIVLLLPVADDKMCIC